MSKHAPEVESQAAPLLDQFEVAQDMLAAHPWRESIIDRLEQDTLSPDQEADYTTVANTIFDTLGVPREEAIDSWEIGYDNAGTSPAVLRLRRAADVAYAASAFGFDRDAPEEDLRIVTGSILEDLDGLRMRAINDSVYKESREYKQTLRALTLLAESGVRELGRRNGLGDSLTSSNLKAVQEATGVRIIKSEPGASLFLPIISSRPQASRVQPTLPKGGPRFQTYYYLPHLAGPNVPHATINGKPGWVPARIGGFVLDASYTGGKLPRDY